MSKNISIVKIKLLRWVMITAVAFIFGACGSEDAFCKSADKNNNDVTASDIKIRLSFDGKQAVAVLIDTPTTRSMLKQLPTTVKFFDYAGAEKGAYFQNKLSREGSNDGYDPEFGDIACYGPWGNVAIYYRDQPYASGLIFMGKIESGIDEIGGMKGDFDVTIVQIDTKN